MTMIPKRQRSPNLRQKTPATLLALTALATSLLTLTACDPSERREAERERESRAYQSASADYKAGRIESATKGFADAVREDPANAEARFQLACLLHDSAKDAAGAFCAYREYLMQRPSGDKAALAAKRLAMCERELAAALAAKHKLTTSSHDAEASASIRNDLNAAKAKIAKLQAELEGAKRKIDALDVEKTRLMAALKGDKEETAVANRPSVKEIQELLDDDDGEGPPAVADEVAALRKEESVETALGSSLLTPRSAEETAALKKAADEKAAANKPKTPVRPATYEVQEGDTLYKISVRFYGTTQAWRKIRDANKALISTDGNVQAGDTIRLP